LCKGCSPASTDELYDAPQGKGFSPDVAASRTTLGTVAILSPAPLCELIQSAGRPSPPTQSRAVEPEHHAPVEIEPQRPAVFTRRVRHAIATGRLHQ